jgi:sugar lactone lactonase YvrE
MTASAGSAAASVVVTLGPHRYRVEPEWSASRNSTQVRAISKLAADPAGRVYTCQRAGPTVVRLDGDGGVELAWLEPSLLDPHGICVAENGNVYVVDRDGHRVFVFDALGRVVLVIGDPSNPRFQAPFNHPTDVAVSACGEIFVADGYGNSMVHRFDPKGVLLNSWGTPGRGAGQFSTPHGICMLAGERLAVGDRENNRVQVFAWDGSLLDIWEDLYHPMEVCVDAQGSIYVSDQTPRISLFSPAGELIGRCRVPLPTVAHGMAVDPAGNVFLAGPRANAVVRLARI